ncbi:MAG: hypothetical protein HY700_01240 [Gemmatimonadetes bacterium]|nr:hypothetical protein [Gemmatimonadota bacterium]
MRGAWYVALLGTLSVPRAPAQTVAELRQRVQALEARHRTAAAAANRADSLTTGATDTIRVGMLTVVAAQPIEKPVRRGVELAWPAVDSLYGDAAGELKRWTLVVWDPNQGRVPRLDPPKLLITVNVNWTAPVAIDPVDVSRRVMSGSAQALHADLEGWRTTPFHRWLEPAPAADEQRLISEAYVELVTLPTHAAQECFSGVLERCRTVLGAAPSNDPRSRWPTPDDRRALVQRIALEFPYVIRTREPLLHSCLNADQDCATLLGSIAPEWLPELVTQQTRNTLIRHAVRLGGRRGYQRLLQSADLPLGVAVADAAGLPVDSVVASWRRAVLAARPDVVTTSRFEGWLAVLWGVVFTTFALASTRWHRV